MQHQLIVILIFGVIAIFNWLVRKGASESRTARPDFPPPSPRKNLQSRPLQPMQSEEERARKFMEALGLPTVTEPSRRITRTLQPKALTRSQKPVARPWVATVPPILPIEVIQTAPVASPASLPENVESSVSIVRTPLPGASIATEDLSVPGATDVQSMLKSPSTIRLAMVLKEILGPPRGLQPFVWTL